MKVMKAPLTILLIFFTLSGYADWQIGEHRLIRNYERSNNTLEVRPSGRTGLRSIGMVTRVGGVNFEAIANLQDYDIELSYIPERENGSRLQLTVDGKAIYPTIPDWQLKPIAEYADSEYTALISLFGEGPDSERYYYIDYHPALEDTLLGLRLLQSDILFMDVGSFNQLPSKDGEVVLGHMENSDYEVNPSNLIRVVTELSSQDYQAWILTDIDESANVELRDDSLWIGINPYYYFWTMDYSGIEEIVERYEETYNRYERAFNANNFSVAAQLEDTLTELEEQAGEIEPAVQPVTALTDAFKSSPDMISNLNPVVRESVVRTAQYAALFRAIKESDSSIWNIFLTDIKNIDLQEVETPNQWAKY